MEGHHFHNDDRNQGAVFVRNTLIANLQNKVIQLPVYDAQGQRRMEAFTMKELGVDFPVIISDGRLETLQIDETGQIISQDNSYGGAAALPGAKPPITVRQYNFRVQFCWKPTPASKRLEAREPKPPAAGAASDVAVAPPPAVPEADTAAAVEPGCTGGSCTGGSYTGGSYTVGSPDARRRNSDCSGAIKCRSRPKRRGGHAMNKAQDIIQKIKRYQFWILCGLVSVIGIVSLVVGHGQPCQDLRREQVRRLKARPGRL